MANSTGELIPRIPAIRNLVMGGSEKARLVSARVDGALAKWRRHYGSPTGYPGSLVSNISLAILTTIEQIFPLFYRGLVENGTPEVDHV